MESKREKEITQYARARIYGNEYLDLITICPKDLIFILDLLESRTAELKELKAKIQEQIHWLEHDVEKNRLCNKEGYIDDYRKARIRAFKTKSNEMIERLKNILGE